MHFRLNGMMDRSVVEYHHGRTFIALQGDLLEELNDGAAFDRRARDMVSQRVGSEVEGAEHRAPAMQAWFDTMRQAARRPRSLHRRRGGKARFIEID